MGTLRPSVHLPATLFGCLVCVIFNFKSFHSFLFKICIMIVHTLNMYTFYFVEFDKIFSYILGLLNLQNAWGGGGLVCVICNYSSFHSFIFKLCIRIVHTLKMCTSYFVHIS